MWDSKEYEVSLHFFVTFSVSPSLSVESMSCVKTAHCDWEKKVYNLSGIVRLRNGYIKVTGMFLWRRYRPFKARNFRSLIST